VLNCGVSYRESTSPNTTKSFPILTLEKVQSLTVEIPYYNFTVDFPILSLTVEIPYYNFTVDFPILSLTVEIPYCTFTVDFLQCTFLYRA
jgi:hypothetical protein